MDEQLWHNIYLALLVAPIASNLLIATFDPDVVDSTNALFKNPLFEDEEFVDETVKEAALKDANAEEVLH